MAPPRRPSQVTDPIAVERALEECDKVGRIAFREKYGFGEARSYYVRHKGKTYDSKAVIGVAFGYQHRTKPLRYDDFSGGAATVKPILEKLGFTVVASDLTDEPPRFRSEWLDIGEVYTRNNLRAVFGITDRTLDNGVFRAKGSRSVWLFVTKDKPKDRPQLHDDLDGDILYWQGQPAGRTDSLLIEHLANGDEVLLFYRQTVRQYPNGGFRYEGPFTYRNHSGSKPASFVFDRDETALLGHGSAAAPGHDSFDPKNIADGRAQVLALVKRRQGQPKFRADLLKAYDGKCALSGCDFRPLLEAAHIYPYRGAETNHVTNGLLLRSDLHSLFDLGLIAVKPDGSLDICRALEGTDYAKLGKIRLPRDVSKRPSPRALEWHRLKVASEPARAALMKKMK